MSFQYAFPFFGVEMLCRCSAGSSIAYLSDLLFREACILSAIIFLDLRHLCSFVLLGRQIVSNSIWCSEDELSWQEIHLCLSAFLFCTASGGTWNETNCSFVSNVPQGKFLRHAISSRAGPSELNISIFWNGPHNIAFIPWKIKWWIAVILGTSVDYKLFLTMPIGSWNDDRWCVPIVWV